MSLKVLRKYLKELAAAQPLAAIEKIEAMQKAIDIERLKAKGRLPAEASLDEDIARIKAKYGVKEHAKRDKVKEIKEKYKNLNKDDDLDTKVRAKLKQEMDRRGFGEADATRHIIDRDRGNKQLPKPKSNKLLQSEDVAKSNYGPKGMNLYNPADSIKRKKTRTGEVVEGIGQNKAVREFTSAKFGTANAQAEREAAADKAKSAKNPVKTYTDEEKAALQAKYAKNT